MPGWLRRRPRHRRQGCPANSPYTAFRRTWAHSIASCLYRYSLLDIIDIADIVDREPAEVADAYFLH